MKKNVIFSGVAILAALSLAACGGGKKAEEAQTTVAGTEQGSGKLQSRREKRRNLRLLKLMKSPALEP